MADTTSVKKTTRITATVDIDTYERMKYWAQAHGVSVNDYLRDAIDLKIAHENKDFQVPSLLVNRMNQTIDGMAVLSSNVKALERIVTSGFNSLLGLTRGENYLMEDDNGEV